MKNLVKPALVWLFFVAGGFAVGASLAIPHGTASALLLISSLIGAASAGFIVGGVAGMALIQSELQKRLKRKTETP